MTKESSTKTLRKLLLKALSDKGNLTNSKRRTVARIAYFYSNTEEKKIVCDNDINIVTDMAVTSTSDKDNPDNREIRECNVTLSLYDETTAKKGKEVIAILNEKQLFTLAQNLLNRYNELVTINKEIRAITSGPDAA